MLSTRSTGSPTCRSRPRIARTRSPPPRPRSSIAPDSARDAQVLLAAADAYHAVHPHHRVVFAAAVTRWLHVDRGLNWDDFDIDFYEALADLDAHTPQLLIEASPIARAVVGNAADRAHDLHGRRISADHGHPHRTCPSRHPRSPRTRLAAVHHRRAGTAGSASRLSRYEDPVQLVQRRPNLGERVRQLGHDGSDSLAFTREFDARVDQLGDVRVREWGHRMRSTHRFDLVRSQHAEIIARRTYVRKLAERRRTSATGSCATGS